MTKGKAKLMVKLLQQAGCYELIREAIEQYRSRILEKAPMDTEIMATWVTEIVVALEVRYRGIIGIEEPVVVHKDLEDSIREVKLENWKIRPLNGHCAADRDGECMHVDCPQTRDNEPSASGRSCPLKWLGDDEY